MKIGICRTKRFSCFQEVKASPVKHFDASEVVPGVWLGSFSAAKDFSSLQSRNILSILTTGRGLPIADLPPIFRHCTIHLADQPDEDLLSNLRACFDFILDAQRNNGTSVLIHCKMGISRSVAVSVAFLVCYHAFTVSTALAHIQTQRKFASPNLGFMLQLQALERAKGNISQAMLDFNNRIRGKPSIQKVVQALRKESELILRQAEDMERTGSEQALWINLDLRVRSMIENCEHADRTAMMVLRLVLVKCKRAIV